eukprot:SAG31_NODE_3098_length_4678_cov_2.509282_3_plen_59_part_00
MWQGRWAEVPAEPVRSATAHHSVQLDGSKNRRDRLPAVICDAAASAAATGQGRARQAA